jgi:hypothetical protein
LRSMALIGRSKSLTVAGNPTRTSTVTSLGVIPEEVVHPGLPGG